MGRSRPVIVPREWKVYPAEVQEECLNIDSTGLVHGQYVANRLSESHLRFQDQLYALAGRRRVDQDGTAIRGPNLLIWSLKVPDFQSHSHGKGKISRGRTASHNLFQASSGFRKRSGSGRSSSDKESAHTIVTATLHKEIPVYIGPLDDTKEVS